MSIIALLVGLALPALGGARENARRLKCLTNLKGIGGGLGAYMNDSKELLPRVRPLHDAGGNTNDPSLLEIMTTYLTVPAPVRQDPSDTNSPFINVSEVFICPSDRVGRDEATGFRPLWQSSGTSYEYIAGGAMIFAEQLTVPDPQKAVSLTYRDPKWRDLPVLVDNDDWHLARKSGPPRNALYFGDWRADWATNLVRFDSSDPRLRELICDIVARYGGRAFPGCD